MKFKLVLSPELKARLGKSHRPVSRANQALGTAGEQTHIYLSTATRAQINQMAVGMQRSVSSVCAELIEAALDQLVTFEQEDPTGDAIIQRGQMQGATSAEIAAATLTKIRRTTNDPGIELPRPTPEDINHGRFDPFTQQWNPRWDRANNKWRA